MFPFKTDRFSFNSDITSEGVEAYLKSNVIEKKIVQITDENEFYGHIGSQIAKFELGQNPARNAFRPIVIIQWGPITKGTSVSGFLRLDRRILGLNFCIPIVGIYISIIEQLVAPVIFTALLFLIVFFILQLFYANSKKLTKDKLTELFHGLNNKRAPDS